MRHHPGTSRLVLLVEVANDTGPRPPLAAVWRIRWLRSDRIGRRPS